MTTTRPLPTCESGTLVMQSFVPGKGDSIMIRCIVRRDSRPTYHVFFNGTWVAGPILDIKDAYRAARELGYVPTPDYGPPSETPRLSLKELATLLGLSWCEIRSATRGD